MMHTHIAKWGHSLGLRIPRTLTKSLGLTEGSSVELTLSNDRLIVSREKEDLKSLLAKVTSENLHQEFSFGKPVGKEVW